MMSNAIYTLNVQFPECPNIIDIISISYHLYFAMYVSSLFFAKHFVNNDGHRSIEMICTTNRLILLFNVHMT